MSQTLSLIVSFIFLGIGLVAVIIMLNVLGKPAERTSRMRWITIHRILGYLFLVIFLVNMVFMTQRMVGFSDEPSNRLLLHISLALLLIPVFLVKILISRFFRKLVAYLTPLGLIIFTLSFLMIFITSAYHLVTSAEIP